MWLAWMDNPHKLSQVVWKACPPNVYDELLWERTVIIDHVKESKDYQEFNLLQSAVEIEQLNAFCTHALYLFSIPTCGGSVVFQCLAGQAPSYLSDDCQPISHSRPRRLRSSDSLTCVVWRAHNTYGDRCFATAGPRVWNSLPIELQHCDFLGRFKRCLKTSLFGSWNYGALWLSVN